jgi:hypothetical protein
MLGVIMLSDIMLGVNILNLIMFTSVTLSAFTLCHD